MNQTLLLGRYMSHVSEDRFDQLVSDERARDCAPLNTWETIAARAREEGLIRERSRSSWAPWTRAAAAVVVLAGGIGVVRAMPPSGGGETVAVNSHVGCP